MSDTPSKKSGSFDIAHRRCSDFRKVDIQKRLLKFISRANWLLLVAASLLGVLMATPAFTRGIIFGGLIVTVNFHLLYRTVKRAFTPPHLASHNAVLAKYYIRFLISGIILFVLISQKIVAPLGLFVGLSIVVFSIILATVIELTKLFFFKEAV